MIISLETTESQGSLATSIAGVKQRSAMNPFLWLVGVAGIVCGACVVFQGATPITYTLIAAFILALFCALGIAVFFAIKSPDKLRSEEYQIRRDMLEYCERTNIAPEKTVLVLNTNSMIEREKQ